ncbi:hypothetical protein NECAME_17686, partial [Necator americanus]
LSPSPTYKAKINDTTITTQFPRTALQNPRLSLSKAIHLGANKFLSSRIERGSQVPGNQIYKHIDVAEVLQFFENYEKDRAGSIQNRLSFSPVVLEVCTFRCEMLA